MPDTSSAPNAPINFEELMLQASKARDHAQLASTYLEDAIRSVEELIAKVPADMLVFTHPSSKAKGRQKKTRTHLRELNPADVKELLVSWIDNVERDRRAYCNEVKSHIDAIRERIFPGALEPPVVEELDELSKRTQHLEHVLSVAPNVAISHFQARLRDVELKAHGVRDQVSAAVGEVARARGWVEEAYFSISDLSDSPANHKLRAARLTLKGLVRSAADCQRQSFIGASNVTRVSPMISNIIEDVKTVMDNLFVQDILMTEAANKASVLMKVVIQPALGSLASDQKFRSASETIRLGLDACMDEIRKIEDTTLGSASRDAVVISMPQYVKQTGEGLSLINARIMQFDVDLSQTIGFFARADFESRGAQTLKPTDIEMT